MNAFIKRCLIVACALVLIGLVVFGAALALGAKPGKLLGQVTRGNVLGVSFDGYRDWGSPVSADGSYAIDMEGIVSVEMDWIAGHATVRAVEGDRIQFSERAEGGFDEADALQYGVEGGVLYIQYCAPERTSLPVKDIDLSLPRALAESLARCAFEGASASLDANGLHAERFTFSAASGDLHAEDMTVGEAQLDAASGDLRFEGEYETLRAGTSSGEIEIESLGEAVSTRANSASGGVALSGDCGEVKVDTASGNISCAVRASEIAVSTASGKTELTLPDSMGFTLKYDTASGDLICTQAVQMRGDTYIHGDGACPIKVGSASGDLRVDVDAE